MAVGVDEDSVRDTRTGVSGASGDAPRAAARRPVELMHPPARDTRTGGHVYNERLVEAARLRGIALSSRAVDVPAIDSQPIGCAPTVRIWDSLFLDVLASRDLTHSGEWGLLLHYLPSRNPTLDPAERRRFARVEARVIEAAALVLVTGRAHEGIVQGLRPGARVFVCEPGVSAAFMHAPRTQPKRTRTVLELLTVANVLPAKGFVELLFALSRVSHVDWHWHVVGDAACDAVYRSRFDAAARQLGLAERIVLHGTLDQGAIATLMDDMDLFVYASRFEAYGMALAEAAARRLPAVTTDVGAAASLYAHGRTALLAPVDDLEKFSTHLGRLMSEPALRERFRDNLQSVKPRTWQDTLNDFMTAVAALG
jgi:glycosyltransferase involved in cell wall biosynthesis